jgi:hypothetical protein
LPEANWRSSETVAGPPSVAVKFGDSKTAVDLKTPPALTTTVVVVASEPAGLPLAPS